jgi:putative transposase
MTLFNRQNPRLINNRTCVFNLGYHIVWSTKNNENVLTRDIANSLNNILIDISISKDFLLKSINILPNQVNIIVESNPNVAPSYIYKIFKGISARKLLLLHPELKITPKNNSLWNTSTYIESIGYIAERSIAKYINNHK